MSDSSRATSVETTSKRILIVSPSISGVTHAQSTEGLHFSALILQGVAIYLLADSCRMEFVRSLSLKEGVSHEVERVDTYSSVMTLFTMNREVILQE